MKAHPYAEAWPLLESAELQELAEDIAANGLRAPIVLHDGMILDGRNRYAACNFAQVEVETTDFEGSDDDALAFVQSINNMRRHQSKGARAASWAISQIVADKRANGRWQYGNSENSQNLTGRMRADLGVIADFAPDLLPDVSYDRITLNAAYEQAKEVKREDDERLAEEARAAEAEAKAERFIRDTAPDLAAKVESGDHESWTEAEAVWSVRNAAEAKARADKERAERDRIAAVEKGIKDALGHISNAIQFLDGGTSEGKKFLRDYLPHHDEHLTGVRAITSERVDAAIDYLTTIRKEIG